MRYYFLTILFLFLLNTNSNSQSFKQISKSISDYEYKNGIRLIKKDIYFDLRKKLDALGKLSFLNKSDSIFILESSSLESGAITGKIWTSSNVLDYSYSNGSFSFTKSGFFTKYCCYLIQVWDTTAIRHEELNHPAGITREYIYGTRVIKTNSNIEIKCIRFKDFFLLERDR